LEGNIKLDPASLENSASKIPADLTSRRLSGDGYMVEQDS